MVEHDTARLGRHGMDDWKKQVDRWGVGGYGPAKESVWGARSRLKRTLRVEPTEEEVHPAEIEGPCSPACVPAGSWGPESHGPGCERFETGYRDGPAPVPDEDVVTRDELGRG